MPRQPAAATTCRKLVIVLGDQLNPDSAAFDDFDPRHDKVWMAEVADESTHVWTHKARIVLFLSAMRHFRDTLRERGLTVVYRPLESEQERDRPTSFAAALADIVRDQQPAELVMVEPGEWRVLQLFREEARRLNVPLRLCPDRHFLVTHEEFAAHCRGRKQLRMEYFYRELRRKHNILMDHGEPVGGQWNYDAKDRGTFGRQGPGETPPPLAFRPDATTRQVMELVEKRFPHHPGTLDHFDWPVTREQARQALEDFVEQRLPRFGEFQDAMWSGHPFLYHALLSASLNLKLLDPRDVLQAAAAALDEGQAALNSVEGFIRQILGWREYVRGVYWRYMPEYLERNELGADRPLPDFYWDGETDMNCVRQVVQQTLTYGYAHHIQRLMVTGLYALLLGVEPQAVHEWYLAVYVDAVEWVELPNTLGMSQFADGGVMASKPYVASGKYIQRMSNYCAGCRYDPAAAVGDTACPITTLYWDFLRRHRATLANNPRMTMQLKNLDRKDKDELRQIGRQAALLRGA